MVKAQQLVFAFCLAALFCAWSVVAQDAVSVNSTDLEVVRTGHFKAKGGPLTLYRLYKTPDGTEGQVHFTEFTSLEPAELQIEKWMKATRTVTSRERNQMKDGQLISDRISAVADLPKSDKNQKEFVIIRRDDLKCYFIESVSLQVAQQIESFIGKN